MATRQQTGGFAPSRPSRAGGGVRPVYEEFAPMSEWKQQEQSHLLLVNLPGFVKEQIKVSVEGRNTLRVRGERLVGGNKWSRFEEDFRIPDECNISGIRAKFEGGTLTITIPKTTSALAPVGPVKQDAKTTKQEPTPLPRDQLPPKTISTVSEAKKTDGKGLTEEPSSRKVATEPPKSQKGQGETPPKPASSAASVKEPADGKGVGLTSIAKIIPETTETKERSEGKMEIKTPKSIAQERAVQKEKETIEKGKESDLAKEKLTAHDVTSAGGGGGSDDGFTQKYKEAMTELIAKGGNLNEDRQLLLNIGTAILVIVALGAYISYTIGGSSSGNTEN